MAGHYKGEYILDGVVYDERHPKANVEYVRDEMTYRHTDIVLATYPKSGTTWTQEILVQLFQNKHTAYKRTGSLFDAIAPGIESVGRDLPETSLGFFQSHLNANYFRRQLEGSSTCPKFIIVIRNPKDVHVSLYYYHKFYLADAACVQNEVLPWDDYFLELKRGHLIYGNIFDHVLSWWKYKDHPNVMHIRYEDLKADTKSTILKMAGFLDMEITDEIVDNVIMNTSFAEMKSKPADYYGSYMDTGAQRSGNPFFRKGEIGSWKKQLNKDQEEYFNENIRQRYLPEGLFYD